MGALAVVLLFGSFPTLAQDVTLSVVGTAETDEAVMVEWTGPDQPGDFIALALPGGEASSFLAYHRTSLGSPALLAISEAGTYEVRYLSAVGLTILAHSLVSVGNEGDTAESVGDEASAGAVEAEVDTSAQTVVMAPIGSLFSLAAVDAGSIFRIAWDFPVGPGARVDIVNLASQVLAFSQPINGVATLSLTAPAANGRIEIRLIGSDGNTLASRQIEVR